MTIGGDSIQSRTDLSSPGEAEKEAMPKPTKWILPFAVVAAAILGWILASNGVNLTKQGAGTEPAAHAVWSHGHDGASANAEEHWEKHGRDFPEIHNAQDYERAAQS